MTIDDFISRYEAGMQALVRLPRSQALSAYERLAATFYHHDERIQQIDDRLAGVGIKRFKCQWQPPRESPIQPPQAPIVYIHGGGWTYGSSDSHRAAAQGLALGLEREVISVNYRLLPEANYLTALEDCLAVIRHVSPAVIAGDSAGGRLAIDAVHQYRRGGANVVLGLIYPVVDTPRLELLGPDAPLFSRADVLSAWQLIADEAPRWCDQQPPAPGIEILSVEHDPLSPMIAQAAARWRHQGAVVGEHMAHGMVHSALQAYMSLDNMASAWQHFCQALRTQIQHQQSSQHRRVP
ncbi:alpha/beta hydrolase fold domain-containing protein [Halomonas huangheensis]|uniref:Alpha/beta hydrolase fold-3 domain-containing protein n=1 Tax=Halomonas huangheensis TaxID=1178482 RepID=W1N3Q3_9GAMM|nr:alpha/beta hydrolase fold domain-containing protein [Halomonas huangheensis]ALM51174.1 hypothetical protein AR456_01855 [Halomonas huangheensis]ERL49590.1 hypothetical protein BJB45_00295 [Halomonas huangheensis]